VRDDSAMMAWIHYTVLGNSLLRWGTAALAMVLTLLALRLVLALVRVRLRAWAAKTTTPIDDDVVEVVEKTRAPFRWAIAVFVASQWVELPARVASITRTVAVLALLVQVAVWMQAALRLGTERYIAARPEDGSARTTASLVRVVATVLLWAVAVLMVLDNLGVNIGALIAGLGIGGIAVALAVQNVLGDLLASLSIALDRPFVPGDLITIDTFTGTVEHVGLKSTRVRAITGEAMVFSNADMLRSRIRNFKSLAERRITFAVGVTYQTPAEVLEAIPGMMREAVEAQPNTRFDRAHFKTFDASCLTFECVYFVTVPEMVVSLDIQQAINLALVRRFAADAIEFAYPTQTLYLASPPVADAATAAAS